MRCFEKAVKTIRAYMPLSFSRHQHATEEVSRVKIEATASAPAARLTKSA